MSLQYLKEWNQENRELNLKSDFLLGTKIFVRFIGRDICYCFGDKDFGPSNQPWKGVELNFCLCIGWTGGVVQRKKDINNNNTEETERETIVWQEIETAFPGTNLAELMQNSELEIDVQKHFRSPYLPDINTASYCPRPAAIIRCFNLLRDGRTWNAGASAENTNMNM